MLVRRDERRAGEILVTLAVHRLAVAGKARVAGPVAGRDALDLLRQLLGVGKGLEMRAVLPLQAIERIERQQLDALVQARAGQREQFFQALRRGDQRRAHVEHVPAFAKRIGPPADSSLNAPAADLFRMIGDMVTNGQMDPAEVAQRLVELTEADTTEENNFVPPEIRAQLAALLDA